MKILLVLASWFTIINALIWMGWKLEGRGYTYKYYVRQTFKIPYFWGTVIIVGMIVTILVGEMN